MLCQAAARWPFVSPPEQMTEAQRIYYQEAVSQLAAIRRSGQNGKAPPAKPRRLKGEAWAALVEKAQG